MDFNFKAIILIFNLLAIGLFAYSSIRAMKKGDTLYSFIAMLLANLIAIISYLTLS